MRYGGNPIEGSNPSLSATFLCVKGHFSKVRLRLVIDDLLAANLYYYPPYEGHSWNYANICGGSLCLQVGGVKCTLDY